MKTHWERMEKRFVQFWVKKNFEKNAFFGPKLAQIPHKMGQKGTSRGVWGVNFGFLRPTDPLGPLKNQFGAKKIFVKKTFF